MIGRELKERRNRLGIIQQHFANLLAITVYKNLIAITKNKVSQWESDRLPIPAEIEKALDIIEERLNSSNTNL